MSKMTKSQMKRMAVSVRSKTFKLYENAIFTIKDMDAVDKIVARAMNRLK